MPISSAYRGQVLAVKTEDYWRRAGHPGSAIFASSPVHPAQRFLGDPGAVDLEHRGGDHPEAACPFWSRPAAARAQLGVHANTARISRTGDVDGVWPGIAIFLVVIGFNLLAMAWRCARST